MYSKSYKKQNRDAEKNNQKSENTSLKLQNPAKSSKTHIPYQKNNEDIGKPTQVLPKTIAKPENPNQILKKPNSGHNSRGQSQITTPTPGNNPYPITKPNT